MASCAYCNSFILFGGARAGTLRFCNDTCQSKGQLAQTAMAMPQAEVAQNMWQLHRSQCPECSGPGPVDVHTSYRVHSYIVGTQWTSRPHVCCAGCGTKKQLLDIGYSGLLGWWGFPWGFLMTPVQILRNIVGLVRKPDSEKPSAALEKVVRYRLAGQVISSRGA